jgi:hypothetical protein
VGILALSGLGADYRQGQPNRSDPVSAESPAIDFTSPANGSSISAGQTLSITLSVSHPEAFTRGISVIGQGAIGATPIKNAPPFEFTLDIPVNLSPGTYQLTALGFGLSSRPIATASVAVRVEPPAGATLSATPPEEVILEAIGEQLPLRVVGEAPGGRPVNLMGASNLTAVSADTSVATVDSQGMVTAVGAGHTVINVTFGGHAAGAVLVHVVDPALIPSLTKLTFGAEAVGRRGQAQSFTVRNAVSYPVRILSVTSSDEFPKTSDCEAISPIPAGGSCTIRVSFAPEGSGVRDGVVTIVNSAVIAPTRVYLTGSGTQERNRFRDRDDRDFPR